MLYEAIKKLVQYGISTGLTPESERVYTTNLLLDVMKEDNYEDVPCDLENINLEDVLAELLDEAVKRGIIGDSITYRDLLDTKLMNCLMPRPSQVQAEFWDKYKISPEAATDYYYKLSQDSDYIRRYRIKKTGNGQWIQNTELLILQSIFPSRKKIRKPSQLQEKQNPFPTRNASSAWKTKAMRAGQTIPQGKITVLYQLLFRGKNGAFSILPTYTTMSTVSCLTGNMFP